MSSLTPPCPTSSVTGQNKDDKLQEVKCVILDRYSNVYDAIVKNCQEKGQFHYTINGQVSNMGLMAQKAEEYRSHDKTFEKASEGNVSH